MTMLQQPRRERRRAPRVYCHVPVVLTQRPPDLRMLLEAPGWALNLSEGGLLAMVQEPVVQERFVGAILRLKGEAVQIRVREVRSQALSGGWHAVAVRFDERDRGALTQIRQWMDATVPRYAMS